MLGWTVSTSCTLGLMSSSNHLIKYGGREYVKWYVPCFSRILNSTMFESWAIVGPYPSWWLFNFLLLVLQVLHIIWSYLIARIAVKAMLRGKVGHRQLTQMTSRGLTSRTTRSCLKFESLNMLERSTALYLLDTVTDGHNNFNSAAEEMWISASFR